MIENLVNDSSCRITNLLKNRTAKNGHFKKISKESRFRLEEYSKLTSSAENTLLSIFRQQSF